MRFSLKLATTLLGVYLINGSSIALSQELAVPIVKDCTSDQVACYATSVVVLCEGCPIAEPQLRLGPAYEYSTFSGLDVGEVVYVIEWEGDWRGVERDDGQLGWIHKSWLEQLAG